MRKSNGTVEDFDRTKLLRSLQVASSKRPVSKKIIQELVDQMNAEVSEKGVLETSYIGERVLEVLKTEDDVAYVRFLSVFKEFSSLEEFRNELARLQPSLRVQKRNGEVVAFDRAKLLKGLVRAINRRPVKYEQVSAVVDRVQEAAGSRGGVISSSEIGEMALAALRELDVVAYVRFASVYRDFGSVNDFLTALSEVGRPPVEEPGNESHIS